MYISQERLIGRGFLARRPWFFCSTWVLGGGVAYIYIYMYIYVFLFKP